MDTPPAHIVITYDDGIDPSGSSLLLLDATGITDVRVDTYCKRQAIRDKFKGQIDEKTFNYRLSLGVGWRPPWPTRWRS